MSPPPRDLCHRTRLRPSIDLPGNCVLLNSVLSHVDYFYSCRSEEEHQAGLQLVTTVLEVELSCSCLLPTSLLQRHSITHSRSKAATRMHNCKPLGPQIKPPTCSWHLGTLRARKQIKGPQFAPTNCPGPTAVFKPLTGAKAFP